MLLLFLLTLTKGISAGLRAERNCRNLPDGVYTTISCDSEFFQCQEGSLHIRACPQGLYFNSNLNKCDYDYTIDECVVEKGINCSKKNDGIYSAGCTSTFFYCSNGVIHHDRCQEGLFYDSERHMCDHKYRVRTCGGNPEFKNEPITRAPVAVPTYAATALRGYMENKVDDHSLSQEIISPGPLSCHERLNGGYQLKKCYEKYVLCVDGVSQLASCLEGYVFDQEFGQCQKKIVVGCDLSNFVKPTVTSLAPTSGSDESLFNCFQRKDGVYGIGCVGTYIACSGGYTRKMTCPADLVFISEFGRCDYPQICNYKIQNSEIQLSQTSGKLEASLNHESKINCHSSPNGNYSLGCQRKFVSCLEGNMVTHNCPGNLVFSDQTGKCEYDCQFLKSSATVSSSGVLLIKSEIPPTTSDVSSSKSEIPPTTSDVSSSKSEIPPTTSDVSSSKFEHSLMSITSSNYPRRAFRPRPQPMCAMGEATPMGSCSSKFRRCVNGRMTTARCPGQTVFDDSISLCVYDLPMCKTDLLPQTARNYLKPQVSGHSHLYQEHESIQVSTPGNVAAVHETSKFHPLYIEGRNWVNTPGVLSNPFGPRFNEVRKKVHIVDDVYNPRGRVDQRVMQYKGRSLRTKDQYTSILDEFDGEANPYLHPSIFDIFPPSYDRKWDQIASYLKKDTKETKELGDSNLVSEEGSGMSPRRRRSYSSDDLPLNSHDEDVLCLGFTSQIVSIGHCRQDFVFCRSIGVGVVAACPIGELFDNNANGCVRTEECGEDIASKERSNSAATLRGPLSIEGVEQVVNRLDACFGVQDGPLSVGCSATYLICSNGIGHEFVCPTGLLFDETSGKCDHREVIIACGGIMNRVLADLQLNYCSNSDGAFALDCSGSFVQCTQGMAYMNKCEEGLVYDESIQSCNNPSFVSSCGRTFMESTITTSSFQASDKSNQYNRDLCTAQPDGLYSEGCSVSFVICASGVFVTSMNCPLGMWFDPEARMCNYKEHVPPCGGSSDDSALDAPPIVAVSPVSPTLNDCPQRPSPIGQCSKSFAVCINGHTSVFDCASPLIFNPVVSACEFKQFVGSCKDFHGHVPNVVSNDTTVSKSLTSTNGSTMCTFNSSSTAFALDFCAREYGVCTEHGYLQHEQCYAGFLFDSQVRRCVPAADCGREILKELLTQIGSSTITTVSSTEAIRAKLGKDDRCMNRADGSTRPLGRCRPSFVRCNGGQSTIEHCLAATDVFSATLGGCVMRVHAPECHPSKPRFSGHHSPSPSRDPTTFCKTRNDGLYRNPTDCAGILQCFGGEVFEYPPCSSGLVFNEEKGKCDYKEFVPDCQDAGIMSDTAVISGCRGSVHGDFVPHDSDCSVFYRCVWDRLERMQCPSGTVFNPALSVCDWPSKVPNCPSKELNHMKN